MAVSRLPGCIVEHTSKLESDLPEAERTVFGIRVLTGAQWKMYQARLEAATAQKALVAAREFVASGLAYVRNHEVMDAQGNRSPFSLELSGADLSDASFQVLHPFMAEIMEWIRTAHQVTEPDLKNSP